MNPFPKTLEAGQKVEYVVTSIDTANAAFTQSKNGFEQVEFDMVVETDEGPMTRRHWVTFLPDYPDMAKDQLKAAGWDGTNVTQLRGVGSKPCKLVGMPAKKNPDMVNWNLRSMARVVSEEQKLGKDRLSKLDDLYSETKIAAAPVARTQAVAARKF